MGTIELNPCPFCGSKDIYRIESYYSCQVTFACSNCGASVGWKENTEEARKSWNTRFNEEEKEMIDYSKIELQKVHTKRHLELAVVKVVGDQVTFRITEQTHRGKDFTPNGEKFKSSCGYFLIVDTYPGFRDDYTGKILFVRGYDSAEDDSKITVSLQNFAAIMEAITEYNETDGKGYEKPWPQNGDWYFYVASHGEVGNCKYDPEKYTHRRMEEIGNFFRTIEEAEAALERVKKALKG